MKIIEVITDTNIGGAGILLCNRLASTDLKKYQTLVLLPRGSELCPRLRDLGADYIEIDCKGDRSFDISAIRKYAKVISAISPDIVNTHGALSARIAAYICRVPVKISTRHCVYHLTPQEKVLGRLNSLLSDRFIAVAHAAKENLINMGVSPRKISVIINGSRPLYLTSEKEQTKLKEQLRISENDTVIGLCARLEACKGHDWLFRCVRVLGEQGLAFKVLLIGKGSREAELRRMCRRMNIEDRVIFCGFVADVTPLMNIVDINVNCSVGTETSSLALSEGMSLGIPCVVSDFGGNPYMVRNGVNGFVCRTGDYRQMACLIKRLAQDKELYRRMSLNAKARFEHELNSHSMTEKTNRLYDSMYAAKCGKL